MLKEDMDDFYAEGIDVPVFHNEAVSGYNYSKLKPSA